MLLLSLHKIEGTIINEDEVSVETTKPVVINADAIRCFYARRNDQPGTRITFTDGGGFAVSEHVSEVARSLGRDDLFDALRPTAEIVSITGN